MSSLAIAFEGRTSFPEGSCLKPFPMSSSGMTFEVRTSFPDGPTLPTCSLNQLMTFGYEVMGAFPNSSPFEPRYLSRR